MAEISQNLATIAAELRTLPERGDSPAERIESAGRLFLEALDAGAFDGPSYAAFRPLVRQRGEQQRVNGFISAWMEAVWRLKGKPNGNAGVEETFANDCRLVADRIEVEAAREPKAWDVEGSDDAKSKASAADLSFEEQKLAPSDAKNGAEPWSDPVAPLSFALQQVWDLLDGQAMLAKEIASACGNPGGEDSIRKRIAAMQKTGRCIKNSPGHGYYRLDAPPSGWTGAERESG